MYQSTAAEFTTEELMWTRRHAAARAIASSRRSVATTLLRWNSSSCEPADLGVGDHHGFRAVERRFPLAGLGEVGHHDLDVGVQLAQDARVRGVLVDADDLVAAPRLQPQDEVLADEPGGAGDGDLHGVPVVLGQSGVRWKSGRGKERTPSIMPRQNQGV